MIDELIDCATSKVKITNFVFDNLPPDLRDILKSIDDEIMPGCKRCNHGLHIPWNA